MKETATAATIIGLPVANGITNDGVITAMGLEEMVLMGLTWGAWFKLGMGLALVLLIMERALSVYSKVRRNLNADSN